MANIVKRVNFGDGEGKLSQRVILRPGSQQGFPEKHDTQPPRKLSGDALLIVDPNRARFLQITDPVLRLLRTTNSPPREREVVKRSLLELLLYWAERRLGI